MDEEKPFRLLDLPDELWTRIGQIAIKDNEEEIRTAHLIKADERPSIQQPAITKVCSALRTELLPYYYKTKTSVYCDHAYIDEIGQWLRALQPSCRRVCHVTTSVLRKSDEAGLEKLRKLLEGQNMLGVPFKWGESDSVPKDARIRNVRFVFS